MSACEFSLLNDRVRQVAHTDLAGPQRAQRTTPLPSQSSFSNPVRKTFTQMCTVDPWCSECQHTVRDIPSEGEREDGVGKECANLIQECESKPCREMLFARSPEEVKCKLEGIRWWGKRSRDIPSGRSNKGHLLKEEPATQVRTLGGWLAGV